MPADRILDCPFCGSSDVELGEFCVTCNKCDAEGPVAFWEEKLSAIELWNRRTGTVYNGKTAEEWYTLYCQESLKDAKPSNL